MKLSIIIPVYNVEAYLEECLDSCLEQDIPHADYEIIAINDGSKDNSLAILERYAAKYSNIRVLSQKNSGVSAARNRGMEVAKGEYIWFIDSDDWIEKNCLSSLLGYTEDIVMFLGEHVERNGEFITTRYTPLSIDKIAETVMRVGPFVYLLKRKLLIDNKLRFEQGICFEDLVFAPLFLRHACSIGNIDRAVYFYRENPNSITQTISKKKCIDYYYATRKLFEYQQTYSAPGDNWYSFFQHYIDTAISCFFIYSLNISHPDRQEAYSLLKKDKELLKELKKHKTIGRKVDLFLLCYAQSVLPLFLLFEDNVIMPLKRKLLSLRSKNLT